MAKLLITAQVTDLAAWEEGFLSHSELFSDLGFDGVMLYGTSDDNQIAVIQETDDPEALIATLGTTDITEAMSADGIIADTVKVILLDRELVVEPADSLA